MAYSKKHSQWLLSSFVNVKHQIHKAGKVTSDSYGKINITKQFQVCNQGYIAEGPIYTICKFDVKKYPPNIGTRQYHWNIDISKFTCVLPVALVIGGMDDKFRFIHCVFLIILVFCFTSVSISEISYLFFFFKVFHLLKTGNNIFLSHYSPFFG